MGPTSARKKSSGHEGQQAGLLVMSPAARQIVQEAMREDVSIAELSSLASADPGFAVRVLALANSAAYAGSRQVGSVPMAASLLGVRGLRNAALGMLVADLVPAAEGAVSLLENCLRRALAARRLAAQSGLVGKDEAFFAGLLLEIGLLHQACDEFEKALTAARSPGRTRALREQSLGLIPHPSIGAVLATELALPESLVSAIAEHHSSKPPESPLSRVCWAAEFVASVLELGDSSRNLRLAQAACSQVGIKSDEIAGFLDSLESETVELARALGDSGASSARSRPVRTPETALAELMLQYEDVLRLLSEKSSEGVA